MKFTNLNRVSSALSLGLSLVAVPFAQTVTETRTTTVTETETSVDSKETTFEPSRAASQTPYATLGLSNVISAGTIGAGRLNVNFRGTFYPQTNSVAGTYPVDAQITTASGAVALGLNQYLDAFGQLNIFNHRGGGAGDGSGFGSSVIGAQASLPLSREVPLRFGAQLVGIFGTSGDQINNNNFDGYNYLETRNGNDVMVRLSQSLLMAGDGTGFNLHFNEGIISSLQSGKDIALVTGVGVEIIPIVSLILGLEANSRTFLTEPAAGDPLWVTPSVTWRSPAFVNVNMGIDVALSPERGGQPTYALEPWRVFGGLSYTIDTKAGEKRQAAAERKATLEKMRADSLQKAALSRQVLSAQQKNDSLARANALSSARSKAVNDSLRAKAYNDSIQAAKMLAEERSKRSEMEKQLLSTGLLLLDAVYFETGKTQISINSEPYLSLIAKMLVKYPKLQIEIGGHTDNVGGLAYNQNLSQGRSEAVVTYMLKVAPELQGRLTAKGYAYSQPKADNKTATGRQLNRRTELKVINKDALKEYNP